MQELRLWNNRKEQEAFEKLGDLYAIIQTTERLESAFTTDAITAAEYEPLCEKLIAQYRTLYNAIRDVVPNIEQFMQQYHMPIRYAATRLRSGLPATVEHRNPRTTQEGGGVAAAVVAETVAAFINSMDTIRIQMLAVDQIAPLLKDLLRSINKVSTLPADYPPKLKLSAWHEKLHALPASHELQGDDVRQLLFDLESCYNEFITFIQ